MGTIEIILLSIAAIILAIKQGLTQAPEIGERLNLPKATGSWNYIPVLLILCAGAVWLLRSEAPMSLLDAPQGSAPVVSNAVPSSVATEYVELMANDATDLQEQRFLSGYVGKRIALDLKVASIRKQRGGIRVQLWAGWNGGVFANFDPVWEEHLAKVSSGDSLRFSAEIVRDSSGRINLENAAPI